MGETKKSNGGRIVSNALLDLEDTNNKGSILLHPSLLKVVRMHNNDNNDETVNDDDDCFTVDNYEQDGGVQQQQYNNSNIDSPSASNQNGTTARREKHPVLLDSWIQHSSSSSSPPEIVMTKHHHHQQQHGGTIKKGAKQSMIIEIVKEENSNNDDVIVVGSNDGDNRASMDVDYLIHSVTTSRTATATTITTASDVIQTSQDDNNNNNNNSDINTNNDKIENNNKNNSLHDNNIITNFTNDISITLSRIHHCYYNSSSSHHRRRHNHHHCHDKPPKKGGSNTNNKEDEDTIQQEVERIIQSFVNRHFITTTSTSTSTSSSSTHHHHQLSLDNLWNVLLESIANDYYCQIVLGNNNNKNNNKRISKKTTMGSSNNNSLSLILGLGIIDSIINHTTPLLVVVEVYNSLVNVLSSSSIMHQNINNHNNNNSKCEDGGTTTNNVMQDEESHNNNNNNNNNDSKRPRIMALGAICLLRCRVCHIHKTLMKKKEKKKYGSSLEEDDSSSNNNSMDDFDKVLVEENNDIVVMGEEGTNNNNNTNIINSCIAHELDILLTRVLPSLVDMACSSSSSSIDEQEERTVVKSAASDACFELLQVSALAIILEQQLQQQRQQQQQRFVVTTDTVRLWKGVVLPAIDRLLCVHRNWLLSKRTTTRMDNMMINKSTDTAQFGVHSITNSTEVGVTHQSSCIDQSSSSSKREKCMDAILYDWYDIVHQSKQLFFHHFIGTELLDAGANQYVGMNLFWNLSGMSLLLNSSDDKINLSSSSSVMSSSAMVRVGGIAQSLCRERGEYILDVLTIGRSSNSSSNNSNMDEATALISLLQEAARLTDGIRIAMKNGELLMVVMKENYQRMAVRAYASWLSNSSSSKAFRLLTSNNDLLESSMSSLILLLRSTSKQCVTMSIVILSVLWSTSPEWMPQSFSDLLDGLINHSSMSSNDIEIESTQQQTIDIDPTSRALCMVVAKAALQRPSELLPQILCLKGRIEIKIEVILSLLDHLSSSQNEGDDNDFVYQAVTKVILENVDIVPHLRYRLRTNPYLISNVPPMIIIPPIIQHLVMNYAQRNSNVGVSSLAGLLCNIMKTNASAGHADSFIKCLISSLQPTDQIEMNHESRTTFLNKNGSLWRMALLDDSMTSDSAYKEVLMAVTRSMIEMPSSITPLGLLACLVDSQFRLSDGDDSTSRIEKRIILATSSVICLSMDQLKLRHMDDYANNEESIFSRLAPLLILRRMPRSYYCAFHRTLPSDRENNNVMIEMVTFLSNKLKAHAVLNDQHNLAREEKKLLAELAGQCLPLSNNMYIVPCNSQDPIRCPISLFENICAKPFFDTLQLVRKNQDLRLINSAKNKMNSLDDITTTDTSVIVSIRQAKAALYAVSHHIPLGLDDDIGEPLIDVASFAFEVLNFPLLEHNMSGAIGEEISNLQSGCLHFIFTSLDCLSCYRKAQIVDPSKLFPLIEEIKCDDGISKKPKTESNLSILDALSEILQSLITIITCGGSPYTSCKFSPSSRVTLLNAIVMFAQNNKTDDGRIDWLASNILPTMVEWTSRGVIDDNIHHIICRAAAFQVIYTLLARCGSFSFLGPKEPNFVRCTLQSALRSFHVGTEQDSSTSSLLRLASLKVILTIIALYSLSGHDVKVYLSPVEIRSAMSALHGAANVDQDLEVRRLANEILPYLQV